MSAFLSPRAGRCGADRCVGTNRALNLGGLGESLAGVVEVFGVEEFSEPFVESGE